MASSRPVAASADQLAGLQDGSDDDPLLPLKLTWQNFRGTVSATKKVFLAEVRVQRLRPKRLLLDLRPLEEQLLQRLLLELGVFVIGFGYPVVSEGEARLRCQISADHETSHLDTFLEKLKVLKTEF